MSSYRPAETGIALGDTEACLTGKTLDGTPFEGCDVVTTISDCGLGYEASLLILPLIWLRQQRRRKRA